MKKVFKILVLGLFVALGSCSEDDFSAEKEAKDAEKWYSKEYQAYFDGKPIKLKLEYQEVGRSIKLDPDTPKEFIDFLKANDKTLTAHVVNDEVYYYSNVEELNKSVTFYESETYKNQRSYNGGVGFFYQHPWTSSNFGTGAVQYDFLTQWAAMGGNGGVPQQSTWSWYGITPWVGGNFNDQITVVGAIHYDRSEPINMVCFEHANWGGKRFVVSKSSSHLHQNATDLRYIIMGYTFGFPYSWDDEISSHFTIQSRVSILGPIGIVYI